MLGAYFEKLGSTSFAVYSIVVTDGQEKTWFVRRGRVCFHSFLKLWECTSYVCLNLDSFQHVNKNWVYTGYKLICLGFKFLVYNKI